MSRLGGPGPASEDKDSAKSKSVKKDKDDDDDAGGSKQPGKGLGTRGSAGKLLPPPESFRPNEVLAYNLTEADLVKIAQRKFKIRDTFQLRSLNFTVTRLETPNIQNAFTGRSALQEELPTSGFGLNHIYSADLTRPANAPRSTDGSSAPMKSAAAPALASPGTSVSRPGVGCAPDRCFGVSVINWQPQLAACARGVRIGVIDTGVDTNHPAFADVLAGKRLKHKDFTPPSSKKPGNHHGTGILSLLAGNPRSSTPGLVPDATFLVADAFFTERNGNAISDTVTMLKAIDWLIEQGVDVANLSFAGPPDEFVHESIRKLARKGTVILAAAGNEGRDAPKSYPAAYPEVIAVTAVDRKLAAYAYAGRGDHIDVAAPGVEIWTALPNKHEGPQTGTSFAVPFVTSIVALNYRSEDQSVGPLEPKKRALALLQKNIKPIGDRGRNPVFGAGLVQAPSHCDPRIPDAVASAGRRLQPALAAPSLLPSAAGAWQSTVHPVANHK